MRHSYLAGCTTPGSCQAPMVWALCGCHISWGPDICGLKRIKMSAADYHLLGSVSWVKGLPKLCFILSTICEWLLLYPFYSWQKFTSESVSNLHCKQVPQLISGTHLCGWSRGRGAGGRWRRRGGHGPPTGHCGWCGNLDFILWLFSPLETLLHWLALIFYSVHSCLH